MNVSLTYFDAKENALDLLRNDYFALVHADGLTSTASNLATSTTPLMDGDTINSVTAQPRGIILDLRIRDGVPVEEAKREILRVIKPKQTGRLVMVHSGRTTEIEGVVESISMPRFTSGVTMQVSLHCSQPYWTDAQYIAVELSRYIDMHYFPLQSGGLAFPAEGIPFGTYDINMTQTYTNTGDADCGMVISITAFGNITNPTLYKSDGSFIGIVDTMVAGDEIVIDTNRGTKSVKKNGVSIFSKLKRGSKFLQMETGDNEFTLDIDSGDAGSVYFTLTFKRRFV